MLSGIEISEATSFTFSVGILTTLTTALTSWVTLKLTVSQHEKAMARLEKELEKQEATIAVLEKWREQVRGAERERQTAELFAPTRKRHITGRFPIPASPVETPKKDE